jgi:hypothetical protein
VGVTVYIFCFFWNRRQPLYYFGPLSVKSTELLSEICGTGAARLKLAEGTALTVYDGGEVARLRVLIVDSGGAEPGLALEDFVDDSKAEEGVLSWASFGGDQTVEEFFSGTTRRRSAP